MQESRRGRRWKRDRACPGFTLPEVLLVLIMLSVVTALAMPAVGRSLQSVRADRVAALIEADLKLAYSLAARQNRPVRLTLAAGQRRYAVTDRASGQVLMQRDFGASASDLSVTSLTSTRTWIDVFPNGLASHAVNYTIQLGVQRRLVSLTRTGHVSVTTI